MKSDLALLIGLAGLALALTAPPGCAAAADAGWAVERGRREFQQVEKRRQAGEPDFPLLSTSWF